MSCQAIKREFKLEKLYYNHPNERIFYCCQWRIPHIIYVAIRLVLALYTIFGFCHQVYDYIDKTSSENETGCVANSSDDDRDNFDTYELLVVYMTVWSYMLLVLHMTLQAVLTIVFYRQAADFLRLANQKDVSVKPLKVAVVADARDPQPDECVHRNGAFTPDGGLTKEGGVSNPGFQNGENPLKEGENPLNGQITSSPGSSLVANVSQEQESKSPPSTEKQQVSPALYGSFSRFQEQGYAVTTTLWYFKVSWVLGNVAMAIAPIVTIVFFVALYPTMEMGKEGRLDLVNTNVHLLNTVIILIDFAFMSRPVRLLHIVATIVYGAIYVLFSVAYWAADRKCNIIYSVLNWNTPGSAMLFVLGLVFVALPLSILFFFILDQLKMKLHERLYGCEFDDSLND